MTNLLVSSTVDLIGNTPSLVLQHSLVPNGKKLFIKLEQCNPNLSVKDRTALGLITKALETGALSPGGVVIESTSGNLGKSLAMLSACMHFKLIVVVDQKVSRNALNWFKAFGAQVEMVTIPDAAGGFQKARIERVKTLLVEHPGAFWPNQYDNPENPRFHATVTAHEFIDFPVDMLVGALSTGGHFSGIAKGVKLVRPEMKFMACDVEGSAIFGSLFHPYLVNGIGLSWRSKNTDLALFDVFQTVSDQEAISMCRILAKDCGLLLGGSSGVVIYAALLALHRFDLQSVMAVAPDSGINYLDQFYDDEWVSEKQVTILNCEEIRTRLNSHTAQLVVNEMVGG